MTLKVIVVGNILASTSTLNCVFLPKMDSHTCINQSDTSYYIGGDLQLTTSKKNNRYY